MTKAANQPAKSTYRAGQPIVIVRGGPAPDPRVIATLPADRYVIAVDRGYDHARTLGLSVDVVVGDLDSISAGALADLSAHGIDVHEYPTDKDATDLELALELAARIAVEPTSVSVLAGPGWEDRFDHVAGQFGLLASPRWAELDLRAYLGAALVRPLHGARESNVLGPIGAFVSLVPVGGPAFGVSTSGLRFPLANETLDVFATRGISNQIVRSPARVCLERGVLLVILPTALEGTVT